jgi:hypothetical protein
LAIEWYFLEFLQSYIEEVKPDLIEALWIAAGYDLIDAVEFFLSDSRVDPSANDNKAIKMLLHVDMWKLFRFFSLTAE